MEQQIIELRENFFEKLEKESPSNESKYIKIITKIILITTFVIK